MSRRFRVSVRQLLLRGGIAVLVGYVVCANCAPLGNELVAQEATAAEAMSEEQFDNPESITKTFVSKLEQLAGKKGVASPILLSKQLETAKNMMWKS